MMPAADASAVVYSHLLDTFDVPRALAHAAFEASLDETAIEDMAPADPEQMSAEQKRAMLRRSMPGRDMAQLAGAR